jgi:predicted DCC family thiol-disulfide oxidoreductase YuxK
MKNFYYRLSELTEITENREQRADPMPLPLPAANRRGWILYDGECQRCIAAAKRFDRIFARRGFKFLPLQTPWVQRRLGLVPAEPLREMRVLTMDGEDFGGAKAIIYLWRQIWWTQPLGWLAQLPGLPRLLDRGYQWIARHRGCTHIACWRNDLGSSQNLRQETSSFLRVGIAPWLGFALPISALLVHNRVAPWVFMWTMAGAIFLGCKWLTLSRAMDRGCIASVARILAYLFLWAGMDAECFLGPIGRREPFRRSLPKLGVAAAKIAAGALLLFGVARLVGSELLAGWIGMTGTIFILHFGIFDLAAICWRMAGITARPIMNAPLRSSSLTEFWGRRWNGAFNQLVIDILFRRFARSFGTVRATLVAFLISGFIHELVISLPAGAGYGLPTSYFLLQGWGVIAQRTPVGERPLFRRGLSGRIFTFVLVGAPAFWLFHPPFVRGVIIPFMKAIGAL